MTTDRAEAHAGGVLLARCPTCDRKIKFRPENRGKTLACPACKSKIDTGRVPALDPAAADPAAGRPGLG